MAELLHRREEAQPAVVAGDVFKKFLDGRFVIRADRAHEHAPAVPDLDMPLPLRRIGPYREICWAPAAEPSPDLAPRGAGVDGEHAERIGQQRIDVDFADLRDIG